MADIKERDVVKDFLKHVKAIGGDYRRVKWQGRVGAPDLLILIPAFGTAWVETKRPKKGKCTTQQLREQALLKRHGERVYVIANRDDITAFFNDVEWVKLEIEYGD